MSAHNRLPGSSSGFGRGLAHELSSLPALALYGTVAALLVVLFGLDPAM
jgi:hypothetical protein